MSAAKGQMPKLQPNLSSLPPLPTFSSSSSPSLARAVRLIPHGMHLHDPQSLTPLMLRSLVRLLWSLVGRPAASVSTLLYYSDLLPQNVVLERLVQHELLDRENYLFHFLINFLRCFW